MYIRLEKSLNGSYLRISYQGNGMWYYRWDGLVPDDDIDTWTMIDIVLAFLNWEALDNRRIYGWWIIYKDSYP